MAIENVEYLREHGPAAVAEMPRNVRVTSKLNGVAVFRVMGGRGKGSGGGTNGRIRHVAYLPDEHSKEAVVEAWLDTNQRYVTSGHRQGVRQRLREQGRQWHDAIDAVFPASEDDR